jgi:hypothetical protein
MLRWQQTLAALKLPVWNGGSHALIALHAGAWLAKKISIW